MLGGREELHPWGIVRGNVRPSLCLKPGGGVWSRFATFYTLNFPCSRYWSGMAVIPLIAVQAIAIKPNDLFDDLLNGQAIGK